VKNGNCCLDPGNNFFPPVVGGAGGGVLRKAKEKRGKREGKRKVGSERRKE